jgi:hypothetical protein
MSKHRATVSWKCTSTDFINGKYSREHTWSFDGGVVVPASPSPSVVPAPWSNPANVDPEEAYVAAVSSCHMLTFLYLAGNGAAPVRWTVYRLRFLISSPSILHPKRSLPPQAAEALGGFFLQCAENRPRIKLQALRSRPTPGVGISANPTLRRFCIRDHAASLAA